MEEDANLRDLNQLVEAILFIAGKPVSASELADSLKARKKDVLNTIEILSNHYKNRDSPIEIVKTIDDKWVMQLKPEFSERAEKYAPSSGESKAVLKTLSAVAYLQPVLQSEVIKFRGTQAYKHLKKLEEGGLIERKPKDRTYILSTTKTFAEYYGLQSKSPLDVKKFFEEKLKGVEKKDLEEKT